MPCSFSLHGDYAWLSIILQHFPNVFALVIIFKYIILKGHFVFTSLLSLGKVNVSAIMNFKGRFTVKQVLVFVPSRTFSHS